MPLQKQVVPVRILGLDTKADPKWTVQGKLELVENAFQRRVGEYVKRDGVTSLGRDIDGGGSHTTGNKVGALDNDLVMDDGVDVYSWNSTFAKWMRKGRNTRVKLDTAVLATVAQDQTSGSAATAGAYTVYVWEEQVGVTATGTPHYSVRDVTTGAYLVSNESIAVATDTSPQVVAIGTTFVILYQVAATIRARIITAAAPTTLGSEVTLVSDVHGTTKFFAVQGLSSTQALVAYRTSTPSVKVMKVSAVPAVDASITDATLATDGDNGFGWLHWDFSDGFAYLASGDSVNGLIRRVVILSPFAFGAPGVQDATATAVRNITGWFDTQYAILYEVAASPVYNTRVKMVRSGVALEWLRSVGLGSQVLKAGGRYYVHVVYGSDTQPTYMLMDATLGAAQPGRRVQAKALGGIAAGVTYRANGLPSVAQLSTTKHETVLTSRTREAIDAGGTNIITGVVVVTETFDSKELPRWQKVDSILFMAGGVNLIYDGKQLVEHGYYLFPETPTLADSGVGTLAAGVYQVKIKASWFDAAGREHRAVSPAASITIAASREITVTIPHMRVTDKNNDFSDSPADSDIVFELYRTVANGSVFFHDTSQIAPSLRTNDTTTDSQSRVFASTDATLITKEILYSQGGVVDTIGPPPARAMTTVANRVFIAAADEAAIWVSKELEEGIAYEFSDELKVPLDDADGAIVAMQGMDEKIVSFKRGSIYVMTGQGPNALGQGNYQTPQRVATTIGAVDSKSLALTPEGIMFKSPKGIYVLTRSLDTTYVGAAVEDANSLAITGAVTIDDLNQVRFVTSAGTTLVYDWYLRGEQSGAWYKYTNQAAVDTALWQRGYVFLASDGKVKQEVAGQSNDDGATIVSKYKLAWISLAGLHGWKRIYGIRVLGEFVGAHKLRLTTFRDFATSGGITCDATPTGVEVYSYECRIPVQPITALQMVLEDLFVAGPSGGFKLTGLSLLAGVKRGMFPSAPVAGTGRMT